MNGGGGGKEKGKKIFFKNDRSILSLTTYCIQVLYACTAEKKLGPPIKLI